jgi:iron-sulfur-dependent L-serine dehydratase beta subunit
VVSLLDIIGPVMVGPSSSHTAGACRIGLLARGLVGGSAEKALNCMARSRAPAKDTAPTKRSSAD